jgi:PTS system mannose-specific IID component
MVHLKRSDLFNVYFRSFLIQGSWNYWAMLGIGFCYCMIPVAKRLLNTPKERSDFLKRHLEFFNGHPYMTNCVLGAVAKLEEESRQKGWENSRPISVFKNRLIGPIGAIGDRLFWNGIKPAVAAIGVFLALMLSWIAVPVFLILYNIPHFYTRIQGLRMGYQRGFDIVSCLSVRRFEPIFTWVSRIGTVATGLCIAAVIGHTWGQPASIIAFTTGLVISLIGNRWSMPVYLKATIATLFAITIAFFV